ncbi:LysR substrate-binding domain-containing protein [Pseudochrobactrum sp. B5]|uniref:LysR substrate-binding domain-containing protein n=1 Tax=Pseudochrobactrum sp. B5 TaxID=1289478 RepID=UPI000950BEB4|nr:LysR substrate-binding domain-containing protein [Pseudochrobactrum sp. B5]
MHRLRNLIPSANYLFAFEAAARRLSFTAAAKELNVSQPAVSKTIRLLEESTGLKLFRRESARLELTPEGQRLYQEVQASFDHLHMVISSLQRKYQKDIVRASFSAVFISLWLLPRLADFKNRYPEIALHIEESPKDYIDLGEEDIDLSARLGNGEWQGLRSWQLCLEETVCVCSPEYLAAHGPIHTPADLLNHRLLHFEEKHRSRIGWREWLEYQGVSSAKLPHDVVFSDNLASMQAAIHGQGISLGWRHLIGSYLESGKLVIPLENSYKAGKSIFLVAPASRQIKSGTEKFRDWILEQMHRELPLNNP